MCGMSIGSRVHLQHERTGGRVPKSSGVGRVGVPRRSMSRGVCLIWDDLETPSKFLVKLAFWFFVQTTPERPTSPVPTDSLLLDLISALLVLGPIPTFVPVEGRRGPES